jgi:uncharacterized protein YqjF (DUF2071 family)
MGLLRDALHTGTAELAMARGQRAAPRHAAHRPWPLPRSPWLHAQSWTDLVFVHWPVEPAVVAPALPPGLPLDTREGTAWISIVAFAVRAARPRAAPPVPVVSDFLEVNLRTYATIDGKPGIVFLTLDATSRLVVLAGRRLYHLPYRLAEISLAADGDRRRLRARRTDRTAPDAALAIGYRPDGPAAAPAPGSLEHWLTERYCLYTAHDGRTRRAQIHHRPWPLQRAVVELEENTFPDAHGVRPGSEPIAHFAARQDVVFWAPEGVQAIRGRR